MFIAQGLQPFLTVVLMFVVGRTLGNEEYGKYNVIFQFFSIFQITSSMGLRTLLTREVAQNRENANKFLVNGLLLGFPSSLLNIAIVVVTIHFLNYESEILIGIYYIIISLVASALTEVLSGALTGFEEVRKLAYAWMIFLVLKTVTSIVVLLLGFGIYALILVHVITKFIQTLIVYYYIYQITGRPIFEIDWGLCKKLIRMGWSMALMAFTISLFWRIDILILEKMVDDKSLGDFSAAYRIFHFMLMTVRSFSMSFLPMISNYYKERRDEFQDACTKSIRFLTIIIIPIAVLTTFASPYVMPLLWGSKFNNEVVANVLQVWVWSIVIFGITEVFGAALLASGRQVTDFVLKAITLVVKIGLTYFLTLNFGVTGPAIATIIALVLLLILQFTFTVPSVFKFKIQDMLVSFVKIILIIGIMWIPTYFLKDYFFLFGMIAAIAVYIPGAILLKIITPDDKRYFKKITKKRRRNRK